ncbi:excinuclease ABC subunit B [Candidatus Woesebacteria bacterium RIFCSPHIGHO2_01_FULL_39_28]|uniref:UvrABC system protein B n=1 Tax=Candidatus Woesebacteria bacterium RIFCSPHIGHO2_01_FULL_39_28 TaxID=1802496 RepID=A0A1F7YIS3_9BACT|nr:MAG: excinuclease ABC subunit B [Candidatus Woesebacteria bacterium RIFCSPHIGHO2_01_FULL_39_28]OGM56953.1 MAG: excinuclease ABC subunit B [Candidatus Woesebacteria bacterium RIFCSPLOWO2_01_FULL_38_20]
MSKFKLKSDFRLTGDQPQAVDNLVQGVGKNKKYQVLLGVTGSGKTFTIANVIERAQKPALIISHNKTLAAQLYQEFKSFFPENAVSYFVSYYDYYQPEAYIPSTDTYIEKDAGINEFIDKLRLATTTNILTRNDVITVASVSAIYNIGSPREYGKFILELRPGANISRQQIIERTTNLQYERSDFGFDRGTFRVRGNVIDVYPAYEDFGVKIETTDHSINKISTINTVSGEIINPNLDYFVLYPAKHYMTDPNKIKPVFAKIRKDLDLQVKKFKNEGKELEAHRLTQKVNYDLEMIRQVGYVKGIENYSRYFDGRNPGDPPYTLLEYFKEAYGNDWLVVVDESHMTFPQIRGMYQGDLSRKQTLVDYGFRLPSAFDNRPLRFEEFMRRIPGFLATSATPNEWEMSLSSDIVEQLVRPTGIPDPRVEIRPTGGEIQDIMREIRQVTKLNQRTLVTTLTKKTAEDLSVYLNEQGFKVHYLHSDVKTLDRSDILDDLRLGKYDVLIGINLLREGLDLPEVALVAILDADKEGFLRSKVSLVQTMGRAARHINGYVILYADNITKSIKSAIEEVERRRNYQLAWNKKYGIIPKSIEKPIRAKLVDIKPILELEFTKIDAESLTPMDRKKFILRLRKEMRLAASDLNFELAAQIRDKIKGLEM